MLDKVKKTISDNNMISENDKVLVALSGGCDSVCLCLVLKELDIDFSVADILPENFETVKSLYATIERIKNS